MDQIVSSHVTVYFHPADFFTHMYAVWKRWGPKSAIETTMLHQPHASNVIADTCACCHKVPVDSVGGICFIGQRDVPQETVPEKTFLEVNI